MRRRRRTRRRRRRRIRSRQRWRREIIASPDRTGEVRGGALPLFARSCEALRSNEAGELEGDPSNKTNTGTPLTKKHRTRTRLCAVRSASHSPRSTAHEHACTQCAARATHQEAPHTNTLVRSAHAQALLRDAPRTITQPTMDSAQCAVRAVAGDKAHNEDRSPSAAAEPTPGGGRSRAVHARRAARSNCVHRSHCDASTAEHVHEHERGEIKKFRLRLHCLSS